MTRITGIVFRITVTLLLVGAVAIIPSCRKSGQTNAVVEPKGDRRLGAHLSVAAGSDYPAAYAKAISAGIDCVPMTIQWSALESNGAYDSAGLLGQLKGFYSRRPVSLSVCISPFAADRRDLPGDLVNTPFDDPEMIDRFNKLLDTVHARLAGVALRYLVIGNEVDLYLSGNSGEWDAYGVFCRAARRHAQMLWGPGLQVAAETTLGATIGSSAEPVHRLQDSLDLLCVTYYPLGPGFLMQPASQAAVDFSTLFSLYPAKQVMFQECGYATGAACGGSDSAQADFVSRIFSLWDQHKDQVPYIAFLWLNDLSQEDAARVAVDYGVSGPAATAFTEYIRTLGLCDTNGNDKPGFLTLQKEASKRGWGN